MSSTRRPVAGKSYQDSEAKELFDCLPTSLQTIVRGYEGSLGVAELRALGGISSAERCEALRCMFDGVSVAEVLRRLLQGAAKQPTVVPLRPSPAAISPYKVPAPRVAPPAVRKQGSASGAGSLPLPDQCAPSACCYPTVRDASMANTMISVSSLSSAEAHSSRGFDDMNTVDNAMPTPPRDVRVASVGHAGSCSGKSGRCGDESLYPSTVLQASRLQSHPSNRCAGGSTAENSTLLYISEGSHGNLCADYQQPHEALPTRPLRVPHLPLQQVLLKKTPSQGCQPVCGEASGVINESVAALTNVMELVELSPTPRPTTPAPVELVYRGDGAEDKAELVRVWCNQLLRKGAAESTMTATTKDLSSGTSRSPEEHGGTACQVHFDAKASVEKARQQPQEQLFTSPAGPRRNKQGSRTNGQLNQHFPRKTRTPCMTACTPSSTSRTPLVTPRPKKTRKLNPRERVAWDTIHGVYVTHPNKLRQMQQEVSGVSGEAPGLSALMTPTSLRVVPAALTTVHERGGNGEGRSFKRNASAAGRSVPGTEAFHRLGTENTRAQEFHRSLSTGCPYSFIPNYSDSYSIGGTQDLSHQQLTSPPGMKQPGGAAAVMGGSQTNGSAYRRMHSCRGERESVLQPGVRTPNRSRGQSQKAASGRLYTRCKSAVTLATADARLLAPARTPDKLRRTPRSKVADGRDFYRITSASRCFVPSLSTNSPLSRFQRSASAYPRLCGTRVASAAPQTPLHREHTLTRMGAAVPPASRTPRGMPLLDLYSLQVGNCANNVGELTQQKRRHPEPGSGQRGAKTHRLHSTGADKENQIRFNKIEGVPSQSNVFERLYSKFSAHTFARGAPMESSQTL